MKKGVPCPKGHFATHKTTSAKHPYFCESCEAWFNGEQFTKHLMERSE